LATYLFASSLKKETLLASHTSFFRGWVVGVVAFLLSVEINKVGAHYSYTACIAWTGMEYKLTIMNPRKFEKCVCQFKTDHFQAGCRQL
jgi:hypothetical protein